MTITATATKTTGMAIRLIFYYKQLGKTAWTREVCTRNPETGEFSHAHKGLIAEGSYQYQIQYQLDGNTVRTTIPGATYTSIGVKWRDFASVAHYARAESKAEQRTAGRPVEGAKKQAKVHKTASSITGAAERFLKLKESREGRNITGTKSSSYINAKRTVDLFVQVCHARRPRPVYHVANIDNECVKAWLVAAKSKWKSSGTVAMLLRNLHGFLGTGKRKSTRGHGLGLNTDVLFANVSVIDPNANGNSARKEIFSSAEIAAMQKAAGELTPERLMLEMALGLGLRAGELANALYSGIDKQVYHVQNIVDEWRPKTNAGVRTIPMRRELAVMLKAYKEQASTTGCKQGRIFCNQSGNKLTSIAVHHMLSKIGKKAGIKSKFNPHKHRHTCLSRWVHVGMNIFDVQAWAGHESLETLKIYYTRKNAADSAKLLDAANWGD
jgi:integrase